jgi:hypothetical protein
MPQFVPNTALDKSGKREEVRKKELEQKILSKYDKSE